MGLNQGDLEKVPPQTSVQECYARIYRWHQRNGPSRLKERYGREDEYSTAYLYLLRLLPPPENATQHDMDFVFSEVISMLLEWSYHEEDEHGIKMAAYAHFAAQKVYAHGFGDPEMGKSARESRLFAAPVSNLLLVISEGRFRVIPTAELDTNNLQTPTGLYLATAPYIIIPRANSLWHKRVQEFERLLNDPKSKESQYQEFFETYPELLKGIQYENVLPHPILERSEQGNLIPDFFLQPVGSRYADILDLKLPTENLIVGGKDRLRFAGSVQEAVAQVREYRDYFEDPLKRSRIAEKYGLTAYRPTVAVIIGRTPEHLEEEKLHQIRETLPGHMKVITYDDLLARMKRFILLFR